MSEATRTAGRIYAGPVALVVATVLALWLSFDVRVGEAVVYLGYEGGFLILPGWVVYRALSASPGGPLRQLVIGWALGYALELIFFMLTAATDHRGLLPFYPLLLLAVAGPIAFSRRESSRARAEAEGGRAAAETGSPRWWTWGLAAITSLTLVYVGIQYFQGAPLPGRAPLIAHFWDLEGHLSLAAEAKHHFPIDEPWISGDPRPYHNFVYMHLAAASQVTGLELPLVFYRLYTLPLLVLITLGIALAGRSLGRHASIGLIAAAVAMFVGEIDLDATAAFGNASLAPFWGFFTYDLYTSPSWVFGLAFFVPLLLLLAQRVDPEPERAAAVAPWPVLLLLMVGASNAKIPILPMLASALALLIAWRWLRERELDRDALTGAGMAAAVFFVLYVLQYRGHPSPVDFHPLAFLDTSPGINPVINNALGLLPNFPFRETLVDAFGAAAALVFLLGAPAIGVVWLRGEHWTPRRFFLFAVVVSAVAQAVLFSDAAGPNLLYPLLYAQIALTILCAEGLRLGWLQHREAVRSNLPRLAPVALAAAVGIVVLIAAPPALNLFAGDSQELSHVVILRYGGLVLLLIAAFAVARRRTGTAPAAALVTALVLAMGAAGGPFDYFRNTALNPHDPRILGKTLNPEQLAGLEWIRDNTDPDDVIAVNNYSSQVVGYPHDYTAYSAYSERRTFIEGWEYSRRWYVAQSPGGAAGLAWFSDRLALNQAAYAGDRAALDRLWSEYGVRFMVVDKLNGTVPVSPCLYGFGKVVYASASLDVLELTPPEARRGPLPSQRCKPPAGP